MNTESPLKSLIEAKKLSDAGNYSKKHQALRKLMLDRPEEFTVDSPDGPHPGITHTPTGFRIHVAREMIPPKVWNKKQEHEKQAFSFGVPTQPPQESESLSQAVAAPAPTTTPAQTAEVPLQILPPKPQTSQVPLTGPAALKHALSKVNLDDLQEVYKEAIKTGRPTLRGPAVKGLNAIEGLKRNSIKPVDLLITKVPVVPPVFRPFTQAGSMFQPGDANELYAEVFNHRDVADQAVRRLGIRGAGEEVVNLYGAVKAVYGYGDPISIRGKSRQLSGMLQQILGVSPKYSWLQRKMVGKPVDQVSRATITVDPELGMDEIGLPESLAWTQYENHIQRRMVRSGMSLIDAKKNVLEKTPIAWRFFNEELKERPVVYTRAPAWHKYNNVAGWVKLIDGDQIAINPLVTTGMNADFDGDECLNQIFAFIPSESLASWTVIYPNLTGHEVKFKQGAAIPAVRDGKLFLFDLEDFPHGSLIRSKEGEKGQIDFHNVPYPIKVIAYDESTGGLAWADVAFWSKHYDREIEIVDTHNGYQLITDDDPRAVYGTASGELSFRRFTPTEAEAAKVLLPRSRTIPLVEETVTVYRPGENSPSKYKLRETITLDGRVGWALGAVCGDGWVTKDNGDSKRLEFSDSEGFNISNLSLCLEHIFDNATVPEAGVVDHDRSASGRYGHSKTYRFCSAEAARFFRSLIGGERDENTSGSANKHLPPFYLSAPAEFRSGLLSGLMDTDGSVSVSNAKRKPQLMASFSSTSIRLCIETKLLAASLGIFSRITPSRTPLGKECWMVSFSNKDFQKWGAPEMCHQGKLEALRSAQPIEGSPASSKYDIIPISRELAKDIRKAIGCPRVSELQEKGLDECPVEAQRETQALYMTFFQASNPKHSKFGAISRQSAVSAVARLGRSFIESLPNGAVWLKIVDNEAVTWERVVGVQRTKIRETGYDLTVPGYETFMAADGIILSNTVQVHTPVTMAAVKEAKEKLLPQRMLMSNKDPSSVVPALKHEQVLSLYTAQSRPARNKIRFNSRQEAIQAIRRNEVSLQDEIEYPGSENFA